MSLDAENGMFRRWLHQAADSVADLYDQLDSRGVIQATDPDSVANLFDQRLPLAGKEPGALLKEVTGKVFDTATLGLSPSFMAYVQSGGTQVGVIGELLSAALNQNCGKWHLSPPGVELEKLVIAWISEFIGYREGASGVLTSGGSAANLICLATARRVMADWDVSEDGVAAGPRLVAYVSQEGHYCLDKSLDQLGIGRKNLRKIPVDREFKIDLVMLEAQIRADRVRGYLPFCVIANAGTVNTGAVDPMVELAAICIEYDLWLHVDAAYGGPAAAVADRAKLFEGLALADSVAVDPHKWLYVPIEAGCALVRRRDELLQTYSLLPEYLQTDSARDGRFDLFEHSFQLSRNFKSLKIYLTFRAYGADGLRQAIAGNIETTDYLAQLVRESDDFEALAPNPLSILCFRYSGGRSLSPAESDNLNQAILNEVEQDGRVFLTGTRIHERTALRVCLVNHRTTNAEMDNLLFVLREIGQKVIARLQTDRLPIVG